MREISTKLITRNCVVISAEPKTGDRIRERPPIMTALPHSVTQFDHVMHQIEDAVVQFELEDGEPMIVEANHAFRDIFSPDMKRVVGLSLNDLIVPAGKTDEAKQFDERTAAGKSNVAFVTRAAADGNRTFLYRGIPYGNDRGFAIYTDVTEKVDNHEELLELF